MRRFRRHPAETARAGLTLLTLAVALGSTGCWAVYNAEADIDRTPVVNTGAGASVIYPGHSAPPHPGNHHPREAGYGQGVQTAPAPTGANGAPPSGTQPYAAPGTGAPAPAPTGAAAHVPPGAGGAGVAQPPPEYASRSTSGGGTGTQGTGITMIGGAETDETSHVKISEAPTWMKYLGLPFAILAAPFEYGAEKAAGEPEPAPAVPRLADQPRPVHGPPAPTDYEASQLRDLERELAMREQPRAAAPPPPAVATPRDPSRSSFADELATLRRRTQPAPAPATAPLSGSAVPTTTAAAPVSTPPTATRETHATPAAASTGEVDRDGDGRSDHWSQSVGGGITRDLSDEDFDGIRDRVRVSDGLAQGVVR
jgi:hypothetical protein